MLAKAKGILSNGWLASGPAGWLAGQPASWLTGWLAGRPAGWLGSGQESPGLIFQNLLIC